jgi:pimeloyl-ACP methyl ester carboxylesterase
MPRTRKILLIVISLLLIGATLIFFAGRFLESKLTFHPVRYASNDVWTLPANAEDVWFKVDADTRLHGWFFHALAAARPAAATVLYFHGNGGNLSGGVWIAERLAMNCFDVLIFDYRGYGRSDGQMTDERALFADADAAYDYLVRERQVRPSQLALYGQSLGTTAAVDVASRKTCGALVLESGLTSASDMASALLPWLPRLLHPLGRNRFDSLHKLQRVHCPVLITHGDQDQLIPVEQGQALFAHAPEPKKLLIVRGADHALARFGGDSYLDSVAAFIRSAIGV